MKIAPSVRYAVVLAALVVALIGGGPASARLSPAAPTFTVNSLGDAPAAGPLASGPCETVLNNNICTLRAAVMKANHYPGGGATINIPAGVIQLAIAPTGGNDETTGDLNLEASMTIAGAGADATSVDGSALDRVLLVSSNITVTISNLTIRNGYANSGGGFFNAGTLILNSASVSGNRSPFGGGGLQNAGTLTLNNSLVAYNTAEDGSGGGIRNDGSLILNNSTVSNNSAASYGGGIINYGTLNAYFSTIAGNLADSDGGNGDDGGGIYNALASTVTLRGSLLAENFIAQYPNQCAGPVTSQGYNLLQTSEGCGLSGVTTGNLLGQDPLLQPLLANGGPTLTRALLAGSPAINAVPTGQCLDRFGAPLTRDQRGFLRPSGGACDIGGYEGSLPAPLFNRNLIRNGDAESGAGSPTGAHVGAPAWKNDTVILPTVVPYGANGFAMLTDPGPPVRGANLFAGGSGGDLYNTNTLSQTIDVASIASAIDAGRVTYELSGYFGGYGDEYDSALMILTFSDGTTDLAGLFIGSVSAASRGGVTKLLLRSTTDIVPAGTTQMFVRLRFFKDDSTYNDGYADNLTLVLKLPGVYLPTVLR